MSTVVVLDSAPSLARSLPLGALRSPRKRPSPNAPYPHTRLVLPGVRAVAPRLAAYSSLCAFPSGGASEGSSLPLPYPHVLAFPLTMRLLSAREFPLPLLGLVHTSFEAVRHTPLPVSEAYELTVYVSGLAPHHRGTEATVVTEARLAGEPAWESRSTYLARHRTASPPPPPAPPSSPLPVQDTWTLPPSLGRAYAAVSGDRNPIHLTRPTARLFGFPRAIAHGMWTAARCLAAAPGDPTTTHIRFRAPVLLPGTVTYGTDGGERFELRGDDGRLHLSGTPTGEAA
ncbi:MaoC/PaaZ C-terminal domain-containing protein [Streptomyces sp. NPDC048106]|uniref:MaoC family dehydratase n=1 Tax=Streptomyces sp. NPDC048106 TaxID=3155750 RepID=UPI00345712BB